jgi:predicted  nucleic acid-binding Zn-ribbon protein
MFEGKKTLWVTISNLSEDLRNANRRRKDYQDRYYKAIENNDKLRALNEKLYNAIDKKNEKIRALQYQIANPGSTPVETISVPARGLDKYEIFIGE